MGQAGAQREPSMEEILASIRRIIENNEPGADARPASSVEAFSQPHADPVEASDSDTMDHEDDYAETDAGVTLSVANDATSSQPVSLADVAARARAVPESRPAETPGPEVARQVADAASDAMDAAAEELRAALTSDEPVETVSEQAEDIPEVPASRQPEPEQAVSAAYSEVRGASADPRQEEKPAADQSVADQSSAAQAAGEPPRAEQTGGGQLVSLQTGEKVAAAFSELDAAIAAGQRRSFDEIAEEMLRPMLTQWLDDNLPTLVERLVREEIERVSRGNRR